MHFSIPDTQELYAEVTGNTYTGYNIYINGSFHCCLRYKQLHALHEQLRRYCSELDVRLPSFPPKRLLPLTNGQLEVRRAALEHYLQLIGQDAVISKLEYFQNFLLSAQQETAEAEGLCDAYHAERLEVSLNGYQLQVQAYINENATILLRKVGNSLQLPAQLLNAFCLYLARKDTTSLVLLRRLMDFESPLLSLRQQMGKPCQILLRKSYWNPKYDLELMQQPVALNLLYTQTVSDVEHEWILTTPDVHQKLRNLQDHVLKKEYLEMARQLPLYGCIQFGASHIDYPEVELQAAVPTLISVGNRELSARSMRGSKIYETKFRVTRMRCWRVTAMHNTLESKEASPSNLQLSFEYLMSKQTLRWITITSEQAMLISVSLQSMVDELLNSTEMAKSTTLSLTDSPTCPNSSPLWYITRNGRMSTTLSSSSSTPSFTQEQSTSCTPTSSTSSSSTSTSSDTSSPTTAPVRFLLSVSSSRRFKQNSKLGSTNTYSAVFFRNAQESVHNEAFEGIGDDDL